MNLRNSRTLVSIIIVNWNGRKWLTDCFSSIYAQNYRSFEIIFVDNASTDGSVAWVKKHYPKTSIVVNETNLGFAHANNKGYAQAKGRHVLFLNNDTRVTKTFLTELVNALESDTNIAGAQSKILLMDHQDTHDSVGAFLTPTGFLYHYGFGAKDKPKYDKRIDLYTAKGACMMFRKEVLDAVAIEGNIFDPDYFAYFEETDLCHRIWLAGYRIVYAYKSVIYHKMGATSTKMDNAFVQYHSFKNRIHSYTKNLGTVRLFEIMPLHLLLCLAFSLFSCVRGKHKLGLAIQRAIWWNVTNFGRTLAKRAFVQNAIRKRPDSSFFQTIMKHPSAGYYLELSCGRPNYEE